MTKVAGIVDRAGGKILSGRQYFSFHLTGDDTKTWYRTGTVDPKVREGDVISFTFEKDNYGNQVDINTLKITGNMGDQGKAPPKPAAKKGGTYQKEDWDARTRYWEKKEIRDIDAAEEYSFRSAHHAAIDEVNAALAAGLLPLAGGNKKEAKWESYIAIIRQVADDNYTLYRSYRGGPPEQQHFPEAEEVTNDEARGDESNPFE